MNDPAYPPITPQFLARNRELAPAPHDAFKAFAVRALDDGALSKKTKHLIAVAVAHVTQSPTCIKGHVKMALQHGATKQELMEAIWVATVMRAGAAQTHAAIALAAMDGA